MGKKFKHSKLRNNMDLKEEDIKKFQDIYEKEYGKKLSREEAYEAGSNLVNFAKVILEVAEKDYNRKLKLKESPEGFHIEGIGYTCFICGSSISNDETWYDKFGIKCLICQKAIDKKIIPGSAAKNKDSWYSTYDLQSRFNIDRHTLKRFVKENILKPRIVPNATGKPHAYLFLIKDNKDTLPPKILTDSKLVKESKDGKDWFHSEPWYRFVDPIQALKDYKIMDHLKVAPNVLE